MLKCKEPNFFLIGTQKSGTYWVSAMLNAHPEIDCIPSMYGGQTGAEEAHFFDNLATIENDGGKYFREVFNRCAEGFYKDIVPLIDKISRKELYEKFKKRYELWLGKFSTKKFMGEKTGEYLLHLDMIDSFYPDIKKVCIIRNPKDRIVSFHFHQLRKGKKTEKEITNKFILDYIHDRAIKDYEALIDYSGNIFCLTYEQLSGETRTTMMSILNYLGVEDLSDSIIERMVEEGSFSNLTKKDKLLPSDSGRQLGEENRNSHYRKGVVGDWKNHLSDSQSVLIDAKLKDLELKVYNKYKLKIYE